MAIAQKIYHHFTWRGVVMLTQLVIHVLLARYLGPEGSGGFFMGLNNLALVILIVGFSLEGAAIYFRLAQKMEPSELAGALLVWALFATTIVALVVLLTGIPLIEELHPAWSIGYVLSFLLINSFSSLFQSEGDFKQYNQVIAGFNILYLIFLGMLLWNRNESGATASGMLDTQWVAIIYAAYFFTVLAQAAVITLRYWMHMAPPRWNRPRMEVFKKLLGYGGMALVSNLVFFLIMRIDYWLVNYYCSQKDLGIYIQVTKATQMLVLPGQLLSTILFPHTAGNQQFVQQPLLMKLLKPFLAGNLIVILLIAFFGEFLIALVWGNAYYSIYTPLLWALPGVLSLTLSYFFSPILAGLGKVSLNIFTGMMTLGVLVITDLLLIPRWGIQGAAIGSSTAFMVMLIIYIIIANKLGFRFQPGAPRSVQ